MKLRTLISAISLLILNSSSVFSANNMREAWLAMPDSMLIYLNENLRRELVELMDMGVKADVRNIFQEETVLDTITDDYLGVKLNESVYMQMRMLEGADSTRMICVVKTFKAPEPESEVRFYNIDWTPAAGMFGLPDERGEDVLLDQYTVRPDTMSQQRYMELRDMIDPVMLSASLSDASAAISFTLSMPLLTADERKEVNGIIKQRTFKWNGEIFKEC